MYRLGRALGYEEQQEGVYSSACSKQCAHIATIYTWTTGPAMSGAPYQLSYQSLRGSGLLGCM